MPRASLLLLLLLSAPFPARAGAPSLALACPSPAQIDPFILMCGQNKFVALQARFCAEALAAEWTSAAKALVPILEKRGKSGRQSVTEQDTARNYRDAIETLYAQIVQMQHYTDVIASYPRVMIDIPGSTGDDTSLSCFNDAFHLVQDVVSFLDGEIVRAKHIRRAAEALRAASLARESSLAGSLTEGGAGGARARGVPAGLSANGASQITGEIQGVLLESRNAAATLGRKIPSVSSPPFVGRGTKDRDGILAVFSDDNRDLFRGAQVRAKPAADGPSVGSTLWDETRGGRMRMLVEPEKAQRGSVRGKAGSSNGEGATAPGAGGGDAAGAGGSVGKAGGPDPEQSPFAAWLRRKAARRLASPETDLFGLVNRRYQATELYKQSRATKRGKKKN